MTPQDMQVIGLCRFSYPALGGFQIEHQSIEERRAFLYTPERMEERFRTFEAIALPGLRAQTDPNFHFLIVIGDCMPKVYMDRLYALVEDMPQVVIVPRRPQQHRPAMQAILNEYRDRESPMPCLQFRHDDDDAIAVTFVEKFRQAAHDCRGLLASNRYFAVDFNQGFSAEANAQGVSAQPVHLRYYGVAFGMAIRPGVRLSLMNFGHNKVDRNMPTVTFTGEDMFLRGHNQFNDSRQGPNVQKAKLEPLDAEGEAHFKATFAIDSDHVRRVFSS